MKNIAEEEVLARIELDNPWWSAATDDAFLHRQKRHRVFFQHFTALLQSEVRRAIILMGARRVGKTVLLHQAVEWLIRSQNVPPRNVMYLSLEMPTYLGIAPERFVQLFQRQAHYRSGDAAYVFFDEVQACENWELHLKTLVDSYPHICFVASGSAAAALRLRSKESGAGRFTDFILPPMMFGEFIRFKHGIQNETDVAGFITGQPIGKLNAEFMDYLNWGGFPEAVTVEGVRNNFRRFIGSDILDKALLRDLPSLYGIENPQQLYRLFAVLAYNTGQEIAWDEITGAVQMAKNTLEKYLYYLEAALLIRIVHRVDHNLKRLKKAHTFKVYLTNPCMRAALFGPVTEKNEATGYVVETAVCAHMMHLEEYPHLHYARWASGEVDFVLLDSTALRPKEIVEVKWSDKIAKQSGLLKPIVNFAARNNVPDAYVTTKSIEDEQLAQNIRVRFIPAALFCSILSLRQDMQVLEKSTSLLRDHALSLKEAVMQLLEMRDG